MIVQDNWLRGFIGQNFLKVQVNLLSKVRFFSNVFAVNVVIHTNVSLELCLTTLLLGAEQFFTFGRIGKNLALCSLESSDKTQIKSPFNAGVHVPLGIDSVLTL